MKKLIELFTTFFKIGLFTFGGGYAMISIIEEDCVEKKGWITHDEMMNLTVIAESTPGPIAINASTFVGNRQAGLAGALAATFGMVLPSFVIIFLISRFFDDFLSLTLVANAFRGIKIAVGFLILDAGLNMVRKMEKKKFQRTVMICACAAMLCINIFAWNFSSMILLLIAVAASFAYAAVEKQNGKGGEAK